MGINGMYCTSSDEYILASLVKLYLDSLESRNRSKLIPAVPLELWGSSEYLKVGPKHCSKSRQTHLMFTCS